MPARDPRFLTVAQVADSLQVSAAEVLELIEAGEIPAITVARHWRIEQGQLDAFIAAQYEVTRRAALWRQSPIASISEPGRWG